MVDGGNAPVFERIMVKITTAVMNGTPEDQSLSPLAMSRQGGAKVCSTIYPGCLPGRTLRGFPNTLERIQGESIRHMYPIPSNLHSIIILPLDLLQCHPSRRGTDQRISTPKQRRAIPAVETSLCFRRGENLLGKVLWLLGHGTRSERPGL